MPSAGPVGLPNNSLMLTRLACGKPLVPGLLRYARMSGAMPEPPGSIARGRWAPAYNR